MDIPDIPDGIRIDWGFNEGDEVSFYYDPMIGKIISHDVTREDAINKLIAFLKNIKIEGIKTNISFVISLLQNNTFKKNKHNTKFIENNLDILNKETLINNQNKIKTKKINIDISTIKIVRTDELKNTRKLKTGGGVEGMKIVFFD
jgi:acetyl/propionyl-CoA carboxylase alpha subunit